MGHTIWVDVRDHADERQDCSIMHRLMDELDALSARLGVAKLSDFYDYSELESAYAEFDPEAEEGAGAGDDGAGGDDDDGDVAADVTSAGEWFEPAAALAAVRALRTRLTGQFEELGFTPDESRSHWPALLMDELAHCEQMLTGAAARGQRFRFLIVP